MSTRSLTRCAIHTQMGYSRPGYNIAIATTTRCQPACAGGNFGKKAMGNLEGISRTSDDFNLRRDHPCQPRRSIKAPRCNRISRHGRDVGWMHAGAACRHALYFLSQHLQSTAHHSNSTTLSFLRGGPAGRCSVPYHAPAPRSSPTLQHSPHRTLGHKPPEGLS